MFFGLAILAVGVIALLVKQGVLSGSIWDYTWPAILIIMGLSLILGRFQRRRWWFFGPPWMWHDRDNDKHV
jgi:hypothetical protein